MSKISKQLSTPEGRKKYWDDIAKLASKAPKGFEYSTEYGFIYTGRGIDMKKENKVFCFECGFYQGSNLKRQAYKGSRLIDVNASICTINVKETEIINYITGHTTHRSYVDCDLCDKKNSDGNCPDFTKLDTPPF